MHRTAIVLSLALLAAVAPAAGASKPVARGVELAAGPALAGSAVLWGERAADGGLVVRAAAPGRRPAPVFRWAAPEPPTRLSLDGLAASGRYVAMVRTATAAPPAAPSSETARDPEAGTETSTALVAGRLGGPFRRISGRRGPRAAGGCRPGTRPAEPALAGSLLVYLEAESRCDRRGERIVDRVMLADLARPALPPRVLTASRPYAAWREPPASPAAPRIAGRYAAWLVERPGGTGARAVDLRTGRTVQAVDRVRGGDRGDILEWFAVGPDGSLALSFQPDAEGHALAVRRRGGSTRVLPQRLPSGSGAYEPASTWVSLRRGRVAFVGGKRAFSLLVIDPSGRSRSLARFTARRPLVGDPSYDGTHVAWAQGADGRVTIHRARAPR